MQEVFEAVNEALKAVSSLVRGGFAGSKASMTVADLALMATYSSLRACKLVDHKSFWYVEAWFKRCRNQVRRKKGNHNQSLTKMEFHCIKQLIFEILQMKSKDYSITINVDRG